MPMIDVYARSGTFANPNALARDLAATLMKIEQVPDIPMFRQNTAAFVHDLPEGALSNVDGTWVLLTEAVEGGWGLAGHANTNVELVDAARAQIAELQRAKSSGG
jgi:hypothetical protein